MIKMTQVYSKEEIFESTKIEEYEAHTPLKV
ncbi:hypothetical protein LCGC14_1548010 [marine sediment metagenome]|uniref:Uncharacterized protein n=1 Tax=marine sediment metagenome TaxID=412755 RepID=A0A0F9L744_9ZZZZ